MGCWFGDVGYLGYRFGDRVIWDISSGIGVIWDVGFGIWVISYLFYIIFRPDSNSRFLNTNDVRMHVRDVAALLADKPQDILSASSNGHTKLFFSLGSSAAPRPPACILITHTPDVMYGP